MPDKFKIAVLVGAAMFCTGCKTTTPSFEDASAFSVATGLPNEEYVETNEPALLGRKQFERGYYGLSERYFREAVEKDPKDLDSWIGLGASYDNLKRFDLADRAYKQALQLGGPSAALLNNMGYSYMLRGDLTRARSTLIKALNLEPGNVVVINNLKLVDGGRAPVPAPKP